MIVYRLDGHRYLVVVNASNREVDFAWLKERELRGSDVRDVSDEYALLAVQGPRALERLGLAKGTPFTFELGELDGVEVMINRTGYTGEEGVELACMDEDAVRLWDAILARGVTPCGLGARDTLRLEVCYPLHGNDIGPQWDAISSGLGWACALETEFTGVGAPARGQGAAGPSRSSSPFVMTEKAIPRQHMAIEGGGEVTSGSHSPMLDVGIGLGYVPAVAAKAGHRARDRRARTRAQGRSREEAHLQEGVVTWPRASRIPTICSTTPSTTGPASTATRRCSVSPGTRRTRSVSSCTTKPPDVGATISKDSSYGEVESVKAVSDLITPLSGEVLEVNQKVVDAPETVNEDPYGDGWLIRIRLTSPRRTRAAARSRRVQQGAR